jgi:Pirin
MGPVDLPKGLSREADVRPHPHIGLSTVTYLFAGEIMHRDSTGVEQAIRPGEMNWMIAGSGITHSERFEQARREGGPITPSSPGSRCRMARKKRHPRSHIMRAMICRFIVTEAPGCGCWRARRSVCAQR